MARAGSVLRQKGERSDFTKLKGSCGLITDPEKLQMSADMTPHSQHVFKAQKTLPE